MQTSVIKAKPAGRKSVLTYLVPKEKKTDSYKWFNSKLNSGEQIFWICPLIEDNEDSALKSIKQTEQVLKKVLNARIAILHGKLTEDEKNQLLSDFKNNVINVLISTTVVEVGVDIPNANIIVIESAEQFGLAQLHQLRGRVGRSSAQAYCFLFSDKTSDNPNIYNRLSYFSKEHDGLKIAEYDLQQRGPGEVYGIRQSGIPALKLANILDLNLINETRKAAQTILKNGNTISF
jgi:ATP-dependent DNA helicase RecG